MNKNKKEKVFCKAVCWILPAATYTYPMMFAKKLATDTLTKSILVLK